MRSAPRRELPPNLKATIFRRCLFTPRESIRNAAGLGSPADSSCTFSGLMACAPGFQFQVQLRHCRVEPLERLWRGLKKRNPPPRRAPGGGVEHFSAVPAVLPQPVAGHAFVVVVAVG